MLGSGGSQVQPRLPDESNNVSTQTVEQQPEWFMLALSSYKMKKYGECLFAVSKAATAMLKRERLDGSKPTTKARPAGASEREDVSLSPVKSETK